MATSSMYIGEVVGFLLVHSSDRGELPTAAVDTVSASIQMKPLSG